MNQLLIVPELLGPKGVFMSESSIQNSELEDEEGEDEQNEVSKLNKKIEKAAARKKTKDMQGPTK